MLQIKFQFWLIKLLNSIRCFYEKHHRLLSLLSGFRHLVISLLAFNTPNFCSWDLCTVDILYFHARPLRLTYGKSSMYIHSAMAYQKLDHWALIFETSNILCIPFRTHLSWSKLTQFLENRSTYLPNFVSRFKSYSNSKSARFASNSIIHLYCILNSCSI